MPSAVILSVVAPREQLANGPNGERKREREKERKKQLNIFETIQFERNQSSALPPFLRSDENQEFFHPAFFLQPPQSFELPVASTIKILRS